MYWIRRLPKPPKIASDALVPAAQYVRMSDEAQQYSIENQKAAIQAYATKHGFVIVRTYADAGRSGVVARNRKGLSELLNDVITGCAAFKAVLVYDVSRWGRFPNSDEAAHYEFLCANSGTPLHYCAEPFTNDGTAVSSLLKALKRSMAAEFSRELGEKVSVGKTRLVEMGFWVGGPPGYGYRRFMVSSEGKPKQLLKVGEHKSLTTDRVILVPGPRREIEGLRAMFGMAGQGMGCTEIACELNRRGFTKTGKPWSNTTVYNTVTNPKYTGLNVWHRTTQRLRTGRIPVKPEFWAKKVAAFPPLVDQQTFNQAQAKLLKIDDLRWTDEQILRRIRRLWKTQGRITESLLLQATNMPAMSTIHKHFGSYRQLYTKLGYPLDEQDFYRGEQLERSMELRRKLTSAIQRLFPQHVEITHLPKGTRSVLRIDKSFIVSVLLCRTKKRNGRLHWVVEPASTERNYITLFCRMSPTHDRILSIHVFRRLAFKSHRSFDGDAWLRTGMRLRRLDDFYATVKKLWADTKTNQSE